MTTSSKKTVQLLNTPNTAAWVLYKLDGGIDHILIDEAQDTNPPQWQVILSLADDFFVPTRPIGPSLCRGCQAVHL